MRNKKLFALAATCMLSTTLLFAGCSKSEEKAAGVDGTYTASSKGIESDVEVSITVEGGKITQATIDASGETEGIGTNVPDAMAGQIVEKQGKDVDVVSGATITSNAALEALEDCMTQAGLTK